MYVCMCVYVRKKNGRATVLPQKVSSRQFINRQRAALESCLLKPGLERLKRILLLLLLLRSLSPVKHVFLHLCEAAGFC